MIIEPRIKRNQRVYFAIVFIIFFSVLMAMRPEETKDTLNYIKAFENINIPITGSFNLLQKYQGYEWGYLLLAEVFKYWSINYRIFFFFVSFTGTTMSVVGLKRISDCVEEKNKDYWGTVLAIYISSFGMLYNGISARAGLAMGIGIFATSLLWQRKLLRGVILTFLAFTIQRSTIIFVAIFIILEYMPAITKQVHMIVWGIFGAIMFSKLSLRLYFMLNPLIVKIFNDYKITGFASYFIDGIDTAVGLRDIYMWLLYGALIVLMTRNNVKYKNCLNVVMAGAFIVVTMYSVRSISRVYDMFFLLMVPCMVAAYWGKSKLCRRDRRIVIFAVIMVNTMLMLKGSFL